MGGKKALMRMGCLHGIPCEKVFEMPLMLRLPNGQSKHANNLSGFFSGGEGTRSRLLDADTDPGCAR